MIGGLTIVNQILRVSAPTAVDLDCGYAAMGFYRGGRRDAERLMFVSLASWRLGGKKISAKPKRSFPRTEIELKINITQRIPHAFDIIPDFVHEIIDTIIRHTDIAADPV